MRLSTVFISSVFVLAGMSTALPVRNEGLLVARCADSGNPGQVKARAYDKDSELSASSRHLPPPPDSDYSNNRNSPSRTFHDRRSYYAAYDNELVARGQGISKIDPDGDSGSGGSGGQVRQSGGGEHTDEQPHPQPSHVANNDWPTFGHWGPLGSSSPPFGHNAPYPH